MMITQNRVSFSALLLIACLALPVGLLSLLAEGTTGAQIDQSDTIFLGRVQALQSLGRDEGTLVSIDIERLLLGSVGEESAFLPGREHRTLVPSRSPVGAGDLLLVLLSESGRELVAMYPVEKDRFTLEYQIVAPLTGLWAHGIPSDRTRIPMATFQAAVLGRKGLQSRGPSAGNDEIYETSGPDPYEPNNTLAEATQLNLGNPHPVTGMPTVVTGLTLTPNDVDFFTFANVGYSLIHAETTLGITSPRVPDTLIGLFDAGSGELLAHDDDGGANTFSKIVYPVDLPSQLAVAVESAPDTNLDFLGDEGLTVGDYDLSLELELGSYITNAHTLSFGVSPDGSFIEDFRGVKGSETNDVLLTGVPADGWALRYGLFDPVTHAVSEIYGGGGDQLTDPGFTSPLVPVSFELLPLAGPGFTFQGEAISENIVAYSLDPVAGMSVLLDYTLYENADKVGADITISSTRVGDPITFASFSRVLDVDLFGEGEDTFFFRFNPNANVKCFPVDLTTNVGNVVPPSQAAGQMTGDLQAAMIINNDDGGTTINRMAYAMTSGWTTSPSGIPAFNALRFINLQLLSEGCTTICIAVDQDPDTGLWAAFGVGLAE